MYACLLYTSMSNYEYDALYDELQALEDRTGVTLSSSPTVNVGYEILSELPKERHPSPMLSLDKTKDVAGLQAFAGDQKVVMSWKMDGLTIVLTYRDGGLVKAVTRGNGEAVSYTHLDVYKRQVSIRQPIVCGAITGLILGDVTQGVIIGATINTLYLGFINAGGTLPADAGIGGIVGTRCV